MLLSIVVTKVTKMNNQVEREKFDNYCAFAMVPMAGLYIWKLFQVLPGTNLWISIAILGIISFVCLIVVWTVHKISKRWIYSIILACLPWCIYSLLQDGINIMKSGKVICMSIVVSFAVAAAAIYLCNLKRHKTRSLKMIIGACMSVAIFCIVVTVPVVSLMNQTVKENDRKSVENECVPENTIEDNVELLSKVSNWKTLSIGSRLDLLQKVAEIETTHLGLREIPTVRVSSMDKNIVGSYVHADNTIKINFDKLSDSNDNRGMKMISTILHECFHAWEHQIVDVYQNCQDERVLSTYPYNQASRYYSEIEDYVSATDDVKKYEKQAIEADAYAYEDVRLKDYDKAIREYISK